MIWKRRPDAAQFSALGRGTLNEHLGMTCTDVGDDYIEVTMPVDARTIQVHGILHGGASVALAETLGSIASAYCIDDPETHAPVGVEINASHLRPVPRGQTVTGRVTPLRIGRRMHVWNIEIRDAEGQLACVSRLTIAVVERRK